MQVSSSQLVPSDIILIPEGKKLPCDLVLLQGDAICDESMLTGESVPMAKEQIPST